LYNRQICKQISRLHCGKISSFSDNIYFQFTY